MNGSTIVRTIAYGYDGDSRLTSASDPSADYSYSYDNLGRVTSETQDLDGLTPTIVYASAYNANSLMTQLTATIGGTADFKNSYAYDYLSRLTQIKQEGQSGGNAVDTKRVDFSYLADGQFDSIARFANLAGTQAVATTTFAYDGIGRISEIQHLISSTQVAGYAYTWDAASRITSIDNFVDGITNYGYDNTNQLTSADNPSPSSDESYSFDENGNRTMSGYTVGTNNHITTDGTYNFTYDDEGNLLTKTTIATGYKEEYTWDYRNRLTFITFKDNSNNVLKTVEQSYDYMNRWIKRSVDSDGPGSNAAVDTFFSYHGDSINADLQFDGDAASDLGHRYLWGPDVDQILADEVVSSLSSAGNTLWALVDHLNSVRDIADRNESTGAVTVVDHRIFNGFGVMTYESNGSFSIIFGFTGKRYDDSTGFQNNFERWYDAYLGRWLSEDRKGFLARDTNLQRYVRNYLVNAIDPDGKDLRLLRTGPHTDIEIDIWNVDGTRIGVLTLSFQVKDWQKLSLFETLAETCKFATIGTEGQLVVGFNLVAKDNPDFVLHGSKEKDNRIAHILLKHFGGVGLNTVGIKTDPKTGERGFSGRPFKSSVNYHIASTNCNGFSYIAIIAYLGEDISPVPFEMTPFATAGELLRLLKYWRHNGGARKDDVWEEYYEFEGFPH